MCASTHGGCSSTTSFVDVPPVAQKLIGRFHRHATEVGHEVSAVGVTGDVAFCTATRVLATERQHITTVATPVCTDVGDRLETMRDTMIYLLCIVVLNEEERISQ